MRAHFDAILGTLDHVEGFEEFQKDFSFSATFIESVLYMSYWYGGLYVVIEGWKDHSLSDSIIDELLKSPNVDLLKRYRNGVFHFQRDYFDERFTKFMDEGLDAVTWVRSLNEEFGRYFLKQNRGILD
jgi:hypothetical protein